MPAPNGLIGSTLLTGLVVGVAALVVAPVIFPGLRRLGAPVARAALRTGTVFYEKGRETSAELGEVFDDFVVELEMALGVESDQSVESPSAVAGTDVAGAPPPDPLGGNRPR